MKELLESEYDYSMFDPTGKNTNMGFNFWLIYVPDGNAQIDFTNVMEKSKLRLDSLVFEFLREKRGKIIIHTTSSMWTKPFAG